MSLMNDVPAGGGGDDKLELGHYAGVLATFIEDCETPMTIGLQGDWGIGKSTMLNMLRESLHSTPKKAKEYRIIEFNTWQYSLFGEDEYLGLAAINAMLKLIAEEFKINDEKDSLISSARKKVTSVLKTAKLGFGPLSIDPSAAMDEDIDNMPYFDISDKMVDLKKDFDELIGKIKSEYEPDTEKIIFFVDDIDRVKPEKALELLESLKNFFDSEHCVFVLAVDYEVVQIGMAQKLGVDLQKTSGKSFFDKIINLPFSMPTQSYTLKEYIKQLFIDAEKTTSEIESSLTPKAMLNNDDNWVVLEEIATCTIGRNPRSIKRAVNYMKIISLLRYRIKETLKKSENKETSLQILRKDYGMADDKKVNITILDIKLRWSLVCMQVAWPELYSYFSQNPSVETLHNLEDWDFLDSLPEVKKIYNRSRDESEVKNNISTFFDILYNLLDTSKNNEISVNEFKQLMFVMYYTKMTEVKPDTQPPYYEFRDRAIKNAESNNKTAKDYVKNFCDDAFKNSRWLQTKQISFKASHPFRYISLIYNRRRIGTIVTLSNRHEIINFRLGVDDEVLVNNLNSLNNPIKLKDGSKIKYEDFIEDFEGSQTGWGETKIDILGFYDKYGMNNSRSLRRLLNQIYRVVIDREHRDS